MLETVTDQALMLGPLLATFLIGICTLFLLYKYSVRNFDYWQKRGIPTAQTIPFLGSVLQSLRSPMHDVELMRYKKYGPLYGHFEGNRPLISVADPALLRDILVKDFAHFTARRDFRTGDPIMDNMVSILQGEDWKRVRTIITPTFTTGKIRRMLGIFKDSARTLVQNFHQAAEKGTHVDAKRVYGAFTMDIIASSAFSTKIDSHNDPDNPFVASARKVFSRNISWRFVLFLVAPRLMMSLGISIFDPKVMNFFKTATLQIIEERRRTGQTRNDFLQLLLDTANEVAQEQKWEAEEDVTSNYGEAPNTQHDIFRNASKKNLSMDELVAQCIIFFIAGYDTTASTLSFCSYALALHPDVQDRARKEVDAVLARHGGELTYEAVQEMKYVDNLISETLRLYPPAIRLERQAEADYKLGDTGLTIPKGMVVTIPNYAMHRDPNLFPDPLAFNPDRFSAEEKAGRDQYAYLPFGAGPRNCVGMRFALMEVKVCLIHVLAHFRIRTCPQTKVPLDYYIGQGLLQPKEVSVKLEKRESCPLVK